MLAARCESSRLLPLREPGMFAIGSIVVEWGVFVLFNSCTGRHEDRIVMYLSSSLAPPRESLRCLTFYVVIRKCHQGWQAIKTLHL